MHSDLDGMDDWAVPAQEGWPAAQHPHGARAPAASSASLVSATAASTYVLVSTTHASYSSHPSSFAPLRSPDAPALAQPAAVADRVAAIASHTALMLDRAMELQEDAFSAPTAASAAHQPLSLIVPASARSEAPPGLAARLAEREQALLKREAQVIERERAVQVRCAVRRIAVAG